MQNDRAISDRPYIPQRTDKSEFEAVSVEHDQDVYIGHQGP